MFSLYKLCFIVESLYIYILTNDATRVACRTAAAAATSSNCTHSLTAAVAGSPVYTIGHTETAYVALTQALNAKNSAAGPIRF